MNFDHYESYVQREMCVRCSFKYIFVYDIFGGEIYKVLNKLTSMPRILVKNARGKPTMYRGFAENTPKNRIFCVISDRV